MAAGSVYIGVLVGPREGPRLRFRGRGLYNICEKLKPLSANCMIHFRLLAINFGPASAISAVQPLSAAFTFLSNAFEIPAQAVITPMAVITRRMINYRLIPKPDLWSAVRRRRGPYHPYPSIITRQATMQVWANVLGASCGNLSSLLRNYDRRPKTSTSTCQPPGGEPPHIPTHIFQGPGPRFQIPFTRSTVRGSFSIFPAPEVWQQLTNGSRCHRCH